METIRFKCPGREKEAAILDCWNTQGQCTYCGSMQFGKFYQRILSGEAMSSVKETKTMYFDDFSKFCAHHATPEEWGKVTELHLAGKLNVKKRL